MRRKLFIIPIILLLIVSIFSFYDYYKKNIKTYHISDVYVVINPGDSLTKISNALFEKKIIKSKKFFVMYTRFKRVDTKIKSGSYIIPKGVSLDFVLDKIASGKSDYKVITIPEGFNIYQIANRLEKSGLLKRSELLEAKLKDYDKTNLIDSSKDVFYELEGYLFPNTYYVPLNMVRDDIIRLLLDEFAKNYNEDFRKRANSLGLTTREVMTIASLVEKEAANDEERKKIAGVIYNRLKRKMPLQIDATVIYGITKGEKNIGRLYYKDYQYDSPYNTYKFIGLPPGPIASPGIKSIEAALYPEQHDYLYYVYTGNGHVFSRTYEEHLKNVNKYIK